MCTFIHSYALLQVSKLPADLQDRRVEITGPVDRKMVINALNSGASVFMADFEDSNAPTWWVHMLGVAVLPSRDSCATQSQAHNCMLAAAAAAGAPLCIH